MLELELIKRRVADYFDAHEFINNTHHEPLVVSQEAQDLKALICEVERLRSGIKKYCHRFENALELWEYEDSYASLKALINEEI